MKIKTAAALLALACLAPVPARAHCHLQYAVTGPAGLFFQVSLGSVRYLGVLPGGTAAQLGGDSTWTDIRILDLGGTIQVSLTGTDLTGSVSCPAVPLNLDGPPACGDDNSPPVFPACTPSFTVTQTAPHVFGCSSTCAPYPQPHVYLTNYAPANSPAPALTSLSPHFAVAQGPSLAVTIDGTGFVGSSRAQWNGAPLTTEYVDGSTLLALITAPLIANAGTNSATVANPGGTSSPLAFAAVSSSGTLTAPLGNPVSVRVFPNPWSASLGVPGMTFDEMPAGSSVKIFTLTSRLVKELDAPAGSAHWDLTNKDGQAVASGYYYYLIDGGGGTKSGRLALIR